MCRCCYRAHVIRVWFHKILGAERKGDYWHRNGLWLMDPSKLR
jgi:hypothetical protein